jgi:hypothetical protein
MPPPPTCEYRAVARHRQLTVAIDTAEHGCWVHVALPSLRRTAPAVRHGAGSARGASRCEVRPLYAAEPDPHGHKAAKRSKPPVRQARTTRT